MLAVNIKVERKGVIIAVKSRSGDNILIGYRSHYIGLRWFSPHRAQSSSFLALALVVPALALAANHDAAMDDEQHQFVHAKLPVHSQYDRDKL